MEDIEKKKTAGGKFLTFFLGKEEYGIEILKVHEIIGIVPITAVPRTPAYLSGIINLRGKIIPVMDIRSKFEMTKVKQTEQTCIIIVQAQGIQAGIIVDRVSEVLNIVSEYIENPPSFGAGVNTEYILGIGKSDEKIKLLLDLDKIITDNDITHLNLSEFQEEHKIRDKAA